MDNDQAKKLQKKLTKLIKRETPINYFSDSDSDEEEEEEEETLDKKEEMEMWPKIIMMRSNYNNGLFKGQEENELFVATL